MFNSLVTRSRNFLQPLEGLVSQTWRNFTQGMAKNLTFEEVTSKLKSPSFILIDVREKGELQTDGKIEGSKNVPVGELATAMKLDENDFKGKYGFTKPRQVDEIIVHCKAGVRAQNAAKVLTDSGYSNVEVYPGILDWEKHGGKLQK